MRLVHGIGTYTRGTFTARLDGRMTPEYGVWYNMLSRCYSAREQAKTPTYIGCTVDSAWLDFQEFMRWYSGQVGFGVYGFQVDKDLISKGNKVYGPEGCVLLPAQINAFLTNRSRGRGDCPLGVTRTGGKFRARLNVDGAETYLGSFGSMGEAFNTFKRAKEAQARALADRWQDSIDSRAYAALSSFTVEIND